MLQAVIGGLIGAILLCFIIALLRSKPENLKDVLTSPFSVNGLVISIVLVLILVFLEGRAEAAWAPELVKVALGMIVGAAGATSAYGYFSSQSAGRDAINQTAIGNDNFQMINSSIDRLDAQIREFKGDLHGVKSLVTQISGGSALQFPLHFRSIHEIPFSMLSENKVAYEGLLQKMNLAAHNPSTVLGPLRRDTHGFQASEPVQDYTATERKSAVLGAIYKDPEFKTHMDSFLDAAARAGMSLRVVEANLIGVETDGGRIYLEANAAIRFELDVSYLLDQSK
jgi:hypothetical protein